MIISESPSKVILFGEHSVVYGYPAIASAINLKTYVNVTQQNGYTTIFSESLNLRWTYNERIPGEFLPLKRIIDVIEEKYGVTLKNGLKIDIKSDVRPGSGLGSSASVAAAFAGALLYYIKGKLDAKELNEIAYEAEKVAHGTPSGIDNTVAVNGGIIKFVKTDNGPLIEKIKLNQEIPLIIVDTGLGRSTRVAVSKVRELFSIESNLIKKIFEGIGHIAERIWEDLSKKRISLKKIGQLMNVNHGLLSAIGVSNSRIEEIVNYSREIGAYGAKITGAGLGGYVLVLPNENNIDEIFEKLRDRYGYEKVLKIKTFNMGTVVREI